MIPRDIKAPTVPIPFHKLLKVAAIVDATNPQTRELLDQIAAQGFEVEVCDGYGRDVAEDASVGAYIGLVDGERLEEAREFGAIGAGARLPHPALGVGRLAPHRRHQRCSTSPARSTATSISGSRRRPSTPSRSWRAW